MEITEVKVFKVGEEKLKAFVSIVIDQCFMVNDIKVISGKEGLFISMPSRRKRNGDFKDVAHPLNNPTRRMIEERILDEYHQIVDGRSESPRSKPMREARTLSPEPESKPKNKELSMDEVEELHLRDSFWSLP
jgi:stage V sporulation protein G